MRSGLTVRFLSAIGLAVVAALTGIGAQVPGRNVNMAAGASWPGGDPFLQRQNEPSMAASTRNPLHLLAGVNDYRTVDIPRTDESTEVGDAWLGLFTSIDGGQRWSSTLVPGYPQDTSPEGMASPLKGYGAGADPVVRAGNSGLMYYAGLVFDRGATGKSAIVVSRVIDNNNNENGNPFAFLGTTVLDTRTGVDQLFVDKPWMAVDIPRSTTLRCTIETPGEDGGLVTQSVPAGAVYVAYTLFQRDAAGEPVRSDIYLRRSIDCGATWQPALRVSRPADQFSQGPTIAIAPRSGAVYVAYRRFSPPGGTTNEDAMMVARSRDLGRRFDLPGVARRFLRGKKYGLSPERFLGKGKSTLGKPVVVEEVSEFDQGSSVSELAFRTNAYPTMAADNDDRVHLAWTERGFAAGRPSPADGDARVVMVTSSNGRTFSEPQAVDDPTTADYYAFGHQIMPSLTFAGGKLMLVYYDLRETRAAVFAKYISDRTCTTTPNGTTCTPVGPKRQTIDIRAAMATPSDQPVFGPSVKVSDYVVGKRPGSDQVEQLQVNPPNLPLFKLGTVPFIGDYIDLASAPSMVPLAGGRWGFNTATTSTPPVFHAVWTDNRDVRPPLDGNWANYTPPNYLAATSLTLPSCVVGQTGMRNQNPYTARITGELVAGSPGNHKTLSADLQRSFVVFAQNTTAVTKYFRMTVLAQPVGGRASFQQFPQPPYTPASPPPLTVIDLSVPARSTAVRTVYATSSDANALITVDVSEIAAVGAPGEVINGAEATVVLNPDIDNPDIDNPDIDNPDIDNPDIDNPDIDNPDIDNVVVANPDIDNPDIDNPDIDNPDIDNPDIDNPDIDNPDIDNSAMTDVTWTMTNNGNTTTGYNVNLFMAQAIDPAVLKTQLILHKTYRTPVSDGCDLKLETRNIVVANIPNPTFITPATPGGVIDPNAPTVENATLWLAPGERGKITLRILDTDKSNNVIVDGASIDPLLVPNEKVTPGIVAQAVGTLDIAAGETEPPVVTPTGSNMFFIQSPTTVVAGMPIAPPVSVQVRDGAGAVVAGASVTLAFGSNPLGAVLTGAGPIVTDASGIATFPALAVSLPGSGFTLVATTTGGLGSVVSVPFAVANAVSPFVVTNTNDSGLGSLRDAIIAANAAADVNLISFAIPGATTATPAVISLASRLPTITSPVHIDATTQPGWSVSSPYRPLVEVNGADVDVETENLFHVAASNVSISALSITQSPGDGVFVQQGFEGIAIRYNIIGSDLAGTVDKGNGIGVRLRGFNSVVQTNVISGNSGPGVLIEDLGDGGSADDNTGDRNLVADNIIGLAPDFVTALPNMSGIVMYDGTDDNTLSTNYISGNTLWGIDIQSSIKVVSGTQIRSNTIGLSATGAPRPNGAGGVRLIDARSTAVGSADGGNVIAGNGGPGVVVLNGALAGGSTSNHLASSNSIHSNAGLGIDLGGDGVTPNDALDSDTGPNLRQNAPVLTSVSDAGSFTRVDFTFNSVPGSTYTLDFFLSATCDPSGYGEGQSFVGGMVVATDPGGTFVGAIEVAPTVDSLNFTAIATDAQGNSSEFSNCLGPAPPASPAITSATPSTVAAGHGQMIVLRGTGLPVAGSTSGEFPRERERQVMISQGVTNYDAHFTFEGNPSRWIVRLPSALATGPATVRLTDPADTTTSNAYPITISTTPGAPVLTAFRQSSSGAFCGAETTTVTPGSDFAVEADGIDTSDIVFEWTPVSTSGVAPPPDGVNFTTGGPNGVCAINTAPALAPGTWMLQIRVTVAGIPSALSNGITVTVP